ncbi:transposase, partial [bacterium]|nr:transposase [bacterium]
MGSTHQNNAHRPFGEPKNLCITPRPICIHCNRSMAILTSGKATIIGLLENYVVVTPHYCCMYKDCPGEIKRKQKKQSRTFIKPDNPFHAPYAAFDYDVQTEVIRLRWQDKHTHKEIVQKLRKNFNIVMDPSAVEPILKIYEITCAKEYRPEFITKIQNNGGIILCIDVMKPIGAKKGILGSHDYATGLTLGAQRMPNGKIDTYILFLTRLKTRIEEELGVKILAVVSDALKEQRRAVEEVFPDSYHCLCHYHFYKLVLKSAKEADSRTITQLRKILRNQSALKKCGQCIDAGEILQPSIAPLKCILEPLVELGKWLRKPKDPCFNSLLFFDRIESITKKLERLINLVDQNKAFLAPCVLRTARILHKAIKSGLDEARPAIIELVRIREHLSTLTDILSSIEESFDLGVERLLNFKKDIESIREKSVCGAIESTVLQDMIKYIATKGKLLMNYRQVPGAPNTNNFQELEFKSIKYILRRILGYSAAKEYLYAHGERILFVNPNEPE